MRMIICHFHTHTLLPPRPPQPLLMLSVCVLLSVCVCEVTQNLQWYKPHHAANPLHLMEMFIVTWWFDSCVRSFNMKILRFWCSADKNKTIWWSWKEERSKKVLIMLYKMPSAFQSAYITSFLCMCCVHLALCPCVPVWLSAMLCCISPRWRWKATWRAALCQRKASVNI